MKYLKDDDNRYRVRFMRATEELMDRLTVAQFIVYLEENAELESDDECEYIGGKVVKCKAYDLKEANSNLHKEFLVTEDGRVFYWRAVNNRIELVDREEAKEAEPEEVKDSGSEKLIDSALVYKEQSRVRFQKIYAIKKDGKYVKDFTDGEKTTMQYGQIELYTDKKAAQMAAREYGRTNGKGYSVVAWY